jgi:general secretion pathway protein G
MPRSNLGFTVIELLVVMALIALTLTIVAPRYIQQTQKASEAVLRNNLKETRSAIDRFYSDNGQYPATLQVLVDRRYLRILPFDPIVGRNDVWAFTGPKTSGMNSAVLTDGLISASSAGGSISDIHSSAHGRGTDGTDYATW